MEARPRLVQQAIGMIGLGKFGNIASIEALTPVVDEDRDLVVGDLTRYGSGRSSRPDLGR